MEGMFINHMWVAGQPSWRQRRRLNGRTEDYPDWVMLPVVIASGIGATAVFLASEVYNVPRLITLVAALALALAGVVWLAGPRRRTQYRNCLIYEGKLLTMGDPVGQLVLFEGLFDCWYCYPDRHDDINATLADFARDMAAARKRFKDPYWYLNVGDEQQAAWQELSSFDEEGEGPLGRLNRVCGSLHWIRENVQLVLATQVRAYEAPLYKRDKALLQEIEGHTSAIKEAERERAELARQLAYNPLWHIRTH